MLKMPVRPRFFSRRVQIGGLIGRYSRVELMNLRVAYDAAGEAIGAGASVLGAVSGAGAPVSGAGSLIAAAL